MIKPRLESWGYEVITASDGEEALKKVREERPDLIILDIMLPVLRSVGCLSSILNTKIFR